MPYSVGPTAENLAYGDATITARRHLSPQQFPPKAASTANQKWIGPMGSYGDQPSDAPLYGYGV